jgi:hypothetical protein
MTLALSEPRKLSVTANANFAQGRNSFSIEKLEQFLADFSKGHFASACAFPDAASGKHVIAARLTEQMNGGCEIYMSAQDVNLLLDVLKRPEHKVENEAGQLVTAYPKLVEALIQAKTNISLYSSDEMQACLSRKFTAGSTIAGTKAANTQQVKHGVPYLAIVKA